jgi:hypothetical protein
MEGGALVYPTVPVWGMLASSFFLFHAHQYACATYKVSDSSAAWRVASARQEVRQKGVEAFKSEAREK